MAESMPNCPFCGGKADTISGHAFQGGFFHNVGCLECEVLFDDQRGWLRRTPPPATQAALDAVALIIEQGTVDDDTAAILQAFLAEWPEPDAKGGE